jgi:hypothetical protein
MSVRPQLSVFFRSRSPVVLLSAALRTSLCSSLSAIRRSAFDVGRSAFLSRSSLARRRMLRGASLSLFRVSAFDVLPPASPSCGPVVRSPVVLSSSSSRKLQRRRCCRIPRVVQVENSPMPEAPADPSSIGKQIFFQTTPKSAC